MNRLLLGGWLCLVAVSAGACKEHGHSHDGGQGGGHEHGHGHDDGADERPTLAVTEYQQGLELFMEYPSFVVGQESPLVAHFTDARNEKAFRVVTRGRVRATLRYASGQTESFAADRLLRDGIFKPVVKPTRAGEASLTLELEGEQVAGKVVLEKVRVFPDVAAAKKAAPTEDAGPATVSFLKEQQWKTSYGTTLVDERVLQGGVRANGEIKAVAGQSAELSAPVAGRVPVGEKVPVLGQAVKQGDLLVRLVPTSMASGTDWASVELEHTRARAELGLATRELERVAEMVKAEALPEKQGDAARVAHEVAAARLAAAERQRSLYRSTQTGAASAKGGAAFELRAPFDGVVSLAEVSPGALVEAGRTLVSVVNAERLWLETRVFEADVPKVEQSPGAAFTVTGFDRQFTVAEPDGRRIAVGAVIDRATRTVPVIYEFPNPEGRLKPGMFAKATLYTGETLRGVAVPESAVVDDGGRPTVFVMDGGESFFKRVIVPGIRSGGFVQVLDGVVAGERVVSTGAYDLKLSTAAGAIPEHGHQH